MFGLVNNAIFWLDGSRPIGTFSIENTSDAIWSIGFVVFYAYLKTGAKIAWLEFQPLLSDQDKEQLSLQEKNFVELPTRAGWLSIVLSVIIIGPNLASGASEGNWNGIQTVYFGLIGILVFSALSAVLFQSIRQTRLIYTFHSIISHIDLFKLRPTHAFSKLTSRTGTIFILFVAFSLLQGIFVSPNLSELGTSNAATFLNFLMLLVGFAIFILPLLSIRNQLVAEKKQYQDKLNHKIGALFKQVDAGISENNLDKVNEIKTTLETLLLERDVVKKISTLPWDTSTFRSFASTILIPVVLWLITELLGRIF